MSVINKLSIRGIRSFGTEKEDEQKINFSSPLTLIVGENGCGKTTVIECLKYALTGETPPGSDRGKTFVHDPKVFRHASSLGQVKLTITDTLGRPKTCIRSMKIDVQKNGKTKFETLDSTIINGDVNAPDQGGRRVEEVNSEMSIAMGVSKAILNNVIFCHQEDSNWPLDEGKKLKEKFDAIFGTTEYNKAIDRIIKIGKEYKEKMNLSVNEKRHFEEDKQMSDRKQQQLSMLKIKQDSMATKFQELNALMAPMDQQMEKLLEKEMQLGKLHGKIVVYEATINNCRTNADNTRQKIKIVLDCDVDELEKQLETFHEKQKSNAKHLQDLENEHQKILGEEKKLNESVVQAKSKSMLLSDHTSKMQELISERSKAIKKIAQDLDIDIDVDVQSQDMTGEELGSTLDRIRRGILEKTEALRALKLQDEKKDHEYQQAIDKLRGDKTASETNLVGHAQQAKKLKEDQKIIRDEIELIETSMPTFNRLLTQIEDQQKDLQKFKSENNVEELKEQRDFIEIDKVELEAKITSLEVDVEKLESISKVTSELEMKERDLKKDQNDFDRYKNKNASTLKLLFPSKTVDRNYKNVVQTYNDELKREVEDIKASSEEARRTGNRLKTERDYIRKQHTQKESELKEINERIYKMCDGRDYIDVLTSQKDKVEKLTMDLAFHQSSESTFKHYITEIQQEQEPCCPLCHKGLNASEGDELKDEIDDKIRQLPSRIEQTERKRKAESKKFDELNQIKSSYDNVEKFDKEVKKLFEDMQKLEAKYQENQAFIEDKEIQVAEPDSKLKAITPTFFSDMIRMDELSRLIASKTKEVDELKVELPNEMPEKSLTEAKNELRQLNYDLKAKNDLMNKLSQEIHATQSNINVLQDKLNTMISKKMENQQKVQGLDRMKIQLKEMEKEKSELDRKTQDEEKKLIPIKDELETLIKKKQKTKNESTEKAHTFQETLNKLKLNEGTIEHFNSDIEAYENMNLENKMLNIVANISQWNDQIKELQQDSKLKSDEIKRLTDAVNNQEKHQRNLEDNMDLRKIDIEKQQAEQSLAKLRKETGEMNPSKLRHEKNELREKRDKIIAECHSLRGALNESEKNIKTVEAEANEPSLKMAHANFMKECYKEATLKEILEDLHKYRVALERSLLKFHANKMKQINQTIRELWNNIYKGNDIDYILIKTDEEDVKATHSDKKRSYNYRVVQAKNGGSEIDMRGRCSAGQKVLASLIIRMALADTFSANCGILALDEPTTNLDQNNIQALCSALGRIVEERERSGNFMLIIITHDEKFVTSMDRAEDYHKLSRDHKGRSRIEKVQNL